MLLHQNNIFFSPDSFGKRRTSDFRFNSFVLKESNTYKVKVSEVHELPYFGFFLMSLICDCRTREMFSRAWHRLHALLRLICIS